MTGAGGIDVDGRENATFRNAAIEAQFHVACSLELFEDGFVHTAVRFHQCGCQDGERATFFNISRRTEELLWWVESTGVDTTRHDAATCRSCKVVRTRQTSDAIENDDNVFTHFHHALGFLNCHFGNVSVLV